MAVPTITLDEINDELNASLTAEAAERLIASAALDVARIIGTADVPDVKHRDAIMAVIGDVWALRQAPNGVRAFAGVDGGVVRVSIDTTRRARTILRPWVGLGIG